MGAGGDVKPDLALFHLEKCTTCFLYFKRNHVGTSLDPQIEMKVFFMIAAPTLEYGGTATYSTLPIGTVNGWGVSPVMAHGKAEGVLLPCLHGALSTILL